MESKLNRLISIVAALLSVLGSLGLCQFGWSLVQVIYEVVNFRIVEPAAPMPKSLEQLPMAALSAALLAAGLSISSILFAIRRRGTRILVTSKWLLCSSGVTLLVAVVPLAWGILIARVAFLGTATAGILPTPDEFEAMVSPATTPLLAGYLLMGVASVLLLGAVAMDPAERTTEALEGPSRGFSRVMAIGGAVVELVALLLLVSIWFNGIAIEKMLSEATSVIDPVDLARQMMGILNKSLLGFSALGFAGLIRVLAAVFQPHRGRDSISDD